MQGGQISLDPSLNYIIHHGRTLVFNDSIIYQQYFELYDIINEVNHSNEVITRFLKVYHMLEYLVYRVELVKIEAKARLNRTFIREIHSLTGKSSSESDILKRNFPVIFGSEISSGQFNLGPISPRQAAFMKSRMDLDPYSPLVPGHVVKLIYTLRNSIVHNKESEFHMTTTNPEEYDEIIPLLKVLIDILESLIFTKISEDFVSIKYLSCNS